MQKTVKSTVAAALIPLAVLIAAISTEAATATPTVEVAATKQLRRDSQSISENYYRNNYERAISRRIISRPGRVRDAQHAIDLAEQALRRGNRNEAARRIAQALVMVEDMDGTREALDLERSLDDDQVENTGQRLRDRLPLLARIFPSQQFSGNSYEDNSYEDNSYEDNYERAIAERTIRRPSRVNDPDEAIHLALKALERGRDNEAAVRFAQALVTIEKMDGTRAALNFERRLNKDVEEVFDLTLRDLSLFRRIFPNR
ncbi:hypothetical protein [Argonema antarcticum]|uniref:hypothetical protein n=1 Tax=Argonema antarcticum TaxID=2942763 RepID=UPI0020130157|nr:hypothetical protein [Argonema antarcticum]MCL1475797.1 hypothetical protein [Argonema antarcticum A004/B2]